MDHTRRLLWAGICVVILLVLVAVTTATGHTDAFRGGAPLKDTGGPYNLRGGDWVGGGGPYNLQLYDNPYYYPYYEARDYMGWDSAGRCAIYCMASKDGGCAVSCR